MSAKFPIVSVIGTSGSQTVKTTFDQIFRREGIRAACIEGDAFRRYTRREMRAELAKRVSSGAVGFSHFSHEANDLAELQQVFRGYGETGKGRTRHYIHDAAEAECHGVPPGEFTAWAPFAEGSDLLFYEGLHGAVVTDEVNIAALADLRIGVLPVINLEWTQQIHRDRAAGGYSTEAVAETVLRRMHGYVQCILPQCAHADITFQRVPVVDTSNPLLAQESLATDETLVVIRFRTPRGIDFPSLLSMLHGAWMSRADTIVIPGTRQELAMQLILTPLIERLVADARTLRAGNPRP